MASPKLLPITDVSVGSLNYDRSCAALSWKTAEARYHVWVLLPSLGLVASAFNRGAPRTLYKNPLPGAEQFRTRQMNPDTGANAKMIEQAMETVNRDSLVAKAIAALDAEDATAQAKVDEQRRAVQLANMAPKLLAVCKATLADLERVGAMFEIRARLCDVIAEAEGVEHSTPNDKHQCPHCRWGFISAHVLARHIREKH
jgi:hypothetical protein